VVADCLAVCIGHEERSGSHESLVTLCAYYVIVYCKNFAVIFSGVARIYCQEEQSWKLGHRALTANFKAGCSSCSD